MPIASSPIIIPDDDDDFQQQYTSDGATSYSEVVILDDNDDEEHNDRQGDRPIEDNMDDDPDLECLGGSGTEFHTVALPHGSKPVRAAFVQGTPVLPHTVIEYEENFFRIEHLFQGPDGKLFASGYTLVRNRNVDNYLPKKVNEVAIYAWVPDSYSETSLLQCQTIIALPAYLIIRECVFTNAPFPERWCCLGRSMSGEDEKLYLTQHSHLTCRRKVINKAQKDKIAEHSFENLSQDDVKSLGGDVVSDAELRKDWLGEMRTEKRLKGFKDYIKRSHRTLPRSFVGDITKDMMLLAVDTHADSYGDVCAGAGGTTRAAVSAGMSLQFMLDIADHMIQTLRLNFSAPGVDIRHESISDFCSRHAHGSMPVDVLHVSFPCCAYSYLNHGGKNDQANIEVGYSIDPLFKITRPLIATFEQVRAIKTRYGGENYQDLIYQLTQCGYSVRARVVKMADYGHTAERARLIIFASCPGQSVPTFPEPTHGPGKRRFTTIAQALARLDYSRIPHHMRVANRKQGCPYDPNRQMSNTFTGGGSLDLHFSGTRTWMPAEAAVLTGFPPHHQFYGTKTSITKQIGNAVPPRSATVLFRHIRQHLRRTDAAFARDTSFIDLT